jgi:glycosyltransferase involved in cell wall biosynthesis
MKLSIITINYNNLSGLIKTVTSVLNQKSIDFEYIIVDGASTDGSVDFIRTLDSTDKHFSFKYVSEPDTGIYNAMNKGLSFANGEYVHFLNSGDWLVDENVVVNMLSELDLLIQNSNQPDVFVGNKISIRPNGKIFKRKTTNVIVSAYTFYRSTIDHTSAYIRKSMFDIVGNYDESLKIVSDWKWYLEALIKYNAIFRFSDIYVSYFDTTGISSINLALDKEERRKVLEEVFHPTILSDYDRYTEAIDQNDRLRRYPFIYFIFYFFERVLFKVEKWNVKYFGWKKL